MLVNWIHWAQSLHPVELLSIVGVLLIIDGTRYALFAAVMVLFDLGRGTVRLLMGRSSGLAHYEYCPSVCLVIAGHNEAETIGDTLKSAWNSYPRMEIIVVDDGSTDGMIEVAQRFARTHPGVRVCRRPRRGGKSSGLNWGFALTNADVIITLDADSQLGRNAIWEIVQPLKDPEVGAVSATITSWNYSRNLVTRLQGYEYRQSIFLGRQIQERLGTLCIVSGAFGAFRNQVLQHVSGWDAGSGEDGDLAIRIRKAGYRIAFAPHAECITNVPESWIGLFRQRLRWDRSVVTFECRKHVDMGRFWESNFRWRNFMLLIERWVLNVVCVFGFWFGWIWLIATQSATIGSVILLVYLCQLYLEAISLSAMLFYSKFRWREMRFALALPFVPLYHFFLKSVSLVAILDELILRKSYDDNYVPQHVRQATWRW